MRALQARMALFKQRGALSKDEEFSIQSTLHKFKTMFPNTPLAKHASLDILLAPPEKQQPRSLILRDLGAVQHDWLAKEFFLAYFEGEGISPPVSTRSSIYDSPAPAHTRYLSDEEVCIRKIARTGLVDRLLYSRC
jgi:hypothetical protein